MKKIKTSALKWVVKNSKSIFAMLAIIIVVSVMLSLCGVILALVSKNVIDAATGQSDGSFLNESMKLFAVVAAQIALQAASSNLLIRANGTLLIRLKTLVFSTLLEKDWQSVSAYHSGDLLNRINSDINIIVTAVTNILPSFLSLITKLVAGFYLLFRLDSTFSIIVLVCGPIIVFAARIYSKKMKKYHKMVQAADGKTSSFMQESIQNMLMIKAFESEKYISDSAGKLQTESYRIKIKRNTISIFANMGLYLIFSASYYIALAWGAYRLKTGVITFGTMTAFLQLINQVQTPFMGMSTLLPQFYGMLASAERLIELEDLPDETESAVNADVKHIYENMQGIQIKNVCFAWENEKENILQNADYYIKKGEFVAIAGTSGVGKSTLIKLILGIIKPSDGEIYVEADNKKYTLDKSMRGLFAYVPQGNMILSGTIKDNIRFSNADASDEDVLNAARAADMDGFVSQLPNGYDTVVGERGTGLSEGQVQRIAIARAILYNAPILLLDECTSALDENTEKNVLENLKAMKNRTCIIISHKKAAIKAADKVITLVDGKIEEING